MDYKWPNLRVLHQRQGARPGSLPKMGSFKLLTPSSVHCAHWLLTGKLQEVVKKNSRSLHAASEGGARQAQRTNQNSQIDRPSSYT